MLRAKLISARDLFLTMPIFILAFSKLLSFFFIKSDAKYSKKHSEKKLNILGNGPSGHETYVWNAKSIGDLAVVNFFALNESFWRYKPNYYILIDPIFFENSNDKNKSLIEEINKINWNMTLYLPAKYNKACKEIFKNSNLNLSFVRHNPCFMSNDFFYWMYKKNLFTPKFQNVINAAIYIGINLGYKNISLHGVESNDFANYFVDSKNEVHSRNQHFYGDSSTNMTREGLIKRGELWRYIRYYSYMFESYYQLEKYSKYIECKIINRTTNSFIDSFDKR